ncbi:MAG: hypothetical protein ACKVX7_19455 [Planctomycetota bacterium]
MAQYDLSETGGPYSKYARSSRWWSCGAALTLVVMIAIPYASGLTNGFVWIDDDEIVQGRLLAKSWADVPALFVEDRNFSGYHRPIYNLIHSLDFAIWKLDPWGYHFSSLVLHLVNAILVFMLLRQCNSTYAVAFASALLWALHPINTAAVGLIHAKADLFVTTSLLAASMCAVRNLSTKVRHLVG